MSTTYSRTIENPTYLKAITEASAFGKPEGFSSHIAGSAADNIIIKQNNTIIALLLEISNKLDKVIKEKETQNSHYPEIDELVNKLSKIEITPIKERIIRKPQKWTFFQLGEEPETSKKNNPDPVIQKTI